MDLGLRGKVVLVTGASRGIGLATARAFARDGATVVMAALTPDRLTEAAQQLRVDTGSQIETYACDLTREEECAKLVQFVLDKYARVDVLVNNASVKLPVGDFLSMTNEEWQSAWTKKLMVYVTMARLVLPTMQHQKGGRIVCVIGAHAARNPGPAYLAAGAVSAGLANFVKGLADLGAKHNILVTGVSPSGVDTDRLKTWMAGIAESEGKTIDKVAIEKTAEYALGRPARPEEVGDVVCFLASARASYISGVVITVDGNLTRGVSM